MRLSTSTNIHEGYKEEPYCFSIGESIKLCARAGYQVLDINLHAAALPGGPLDSSGWEDWVEEIQEEKERLKLVFSQGHAHFYTLPVGDEEVPWHEEMMRRSIIAAGRLGISWLVLHPFSAEDGAWYSRRGSLEYNVKRMKQYEAIAEPYPNLGFAIENMVESREKRRFGSSVEDLTDLCDALKSERFGLCWDFGHAERSGINQCESLRQMGKLLKATHVEDTNGLYFGCDHLLPYVGMTDWDRIMPVLREIGYEGDITFEVHNFTHHMPPELREAAIRFSFATGNYLLKLAEGGKSE